MLAKDIIKRVKEIQIATGRQVADVLAGQYESVFKGGGIEFDEVRPYIPGDEIRSIDWNVTARMGEPFVKRFVEDRELTLMLMADISASQDFGSANRSKREAVAELCALLAFSANFNDDKVGLTLFHGDIEQYIPPRKGQKHSLRVVREVLAHGLPIGPHKKPEPTRTWRNWFSASRIKNRRFRSPRQATNIAGAVEFLLNVSRRKTVCFLVSDFHDANYLKVLQSANRKHDVIAVMVTDPLELELPRQGLLQWVDTESGAPMVIDCSSKAVRDRFQKAARARVEHIERQLRSSRIDFVRIDCSQSVVDPLVKFFRMREQRKNR